MIGVALVQRVLLVELALIALALGAVFGHAIWYRRDSARRLVLLAAGRGPLIRAIGARRPTDDLGALRAMPRRVLVRLLADIAPSLSGPHRDTIGEVAGALGLTRSAERSLRSRLWWRRLQGARLLTLIGGDMQALDGLRGDRHPLVRAQRAEALGQHPSPTAVDELVVLLSDPDGTVRCVARDSLMRLGAMAQEPVQRGLASPDPEDLGVLLEIAAAIPSSEFLAAALRHSVDEDPLIRVRAARLLRAIGGPAALERLTELTSDPDADVRSTAVAAIGTLGHWPAAVALAQRLADPEWEVRLAAAVALQRLGAPGELLLRRARDGAAGPAQDVARQVLDVADRLRIAPVR